MAGIALLNQNLAGFVLPSLTTPAFVLAILKTCLISALNLVLFGHQLYQYRKPSDIFRFVSFVGLAFTRGNRSWPHNKLLKGVRFAHWTAVHLHMCGFASQNSTTHMQTHSRRLPRR